MSSVGTIVGGIFLILLGIGGIILSAYLSSILGILICVALIILFVILTIVDVFKISYNNSMPLDVIIYTDGVFTVDDETGGKISFVSSDIIDMDYKLKVTHVFTLHYSSTTTWNYGRLRIWLQIQGNSDECTRITLDNIVDPDRVIDKIQCIIELKSTADK